MKILTQNISLNVKLFSEIDPENATIAIEELKKIGKIHKSINGFNNERSKVRRHIFSRFL